jgi:alkylation response protein AidB-like acyl-CoA dehydrogenase
MNLALSEEQDMLRDLVRGLCNEHSPLEVVREMEGDPKGYPDALWKQLGEVGLHGLLIPEKFGGSDQSLLDAAVVYEELGRALAPVPHFASCVVAAGCLRRAGRDAQQEEWLTRIVSGDAILSPAWLEPGNGFAAKGVQMRAAPAGDGFVLSGTKLHVPFASAATRLVVLARTGAAEEEVDLFLVDPHAQGVSLVQQQALASDCQYRVDFDDVRVEATARIGTAGRGWSTWERTLEDAVVLLAAQAIGGAEKALEITTQYAKDRKQFGKPLGAFQSISHYLADAKTAIDGGRTLVYKAAWARDDGRDAARLAPMSKLFACQTFRDVTAMCQQVWGGVGFTIEYDIQLFFRRAKQLQITWWDSSTLEQRIAADVLEKRTI